MGPAGARYLRKRNSDVVHRLDSSTFSYEQDRDKGGFPLQGTWAVHRARDFEECMEWVVDLIGLDLTVRAL